MLHREGRERKRDRGRWGFFSTFPPLFLSPSCSCLLGLWETAKQNDHQSRRASCLLCTTPPSPGVEHKGPYGPDQAQIRAQRWQVPVLAPVAKGVGTGLSSLEQSTDVLRNPIGPTSGREREREQKRARERERGRQGSLDLSALGMQRHWERVASVDNMSTGSPPLSLPSHTLCTRSSAG